MDLNLFFNPVDEELVEGIKSPHAVSKSFTINNYKIEDIENHDLALIGLVDDRESSTSGQLEKATSIIREKLYRLKKGIGAFDVIDLGDLRNGPGTDDTRQRLEEVCSWLLSKNVLPVIIGGSQDNVVSQYKAYEQLNKLVTLLNVDALIDLSDDTSKPMNERWLYDVFTSDHNYLFNYIHLAHQSYLNDQPSIDTLETLFFDTVRLGQIKSDIKNSEPLIREADIMTIDLSAIQRSYSTGNPHNQVFGLTGEEACQMCWYAGLNSKLSSVGFYEYYPALDDDQGSSASVVATMVWYFIEGFYERRQERGFGSNDYYKYEVSLDGDPNSIVFYKSKLSEKWWMEVPFTDDRHKFSRNAMVPCNYSDYEVAMKGEIPERWIEMQTKFN